jgi:precorrin-2 dehydrogenase/sirohydrochlorin ferrochelatase
MLIKVEDKEILVVGGGKIASDKVEKLLNFTDKITILSKEFSPTLLSFAERYNLKLLSKSYQSGDIEGFNIVVVAVDEIKLQEEIYLESRKKGILINSVDGTEYCDFIFPSFVKKGDLVVSFSTSGTSPAFSKHLRAYFQRVIPDSVSRFLQNMRELRETLPKGKSRMEMFNKYAEEFISKEFKL